jgi:hypothetical protein
MLSAREYMLKLELELMSGGGRWVADFTESFWDYDVDGVTFDMFIHGGMRPQGYALSRLVAKFAMPDYLAGCFVRQLKPDGAGLTKTIKCVRRHIEDREMRWAWLVLPAEVPFEARVAKRVQANDLREVGIALVNVTEGTVVANQSYPGRRMSRFIGCFK